MALESRVLSQQEFLPFAKQVVPFLHNTSRIPGKKDDDLLTRIGGRGFPTLCFMDADGKVIHFQIGRSLPQFQKGLQMSKAFIALSAKASADVQAAQEMLLLKLDMGKLSFAQAVEEAAAMEFSAAERLLFETKVIETLYRLPSLAQAKKALALMNLQDAGFKEADLQAATKARVQEILTDLEIRQYIRPLLGGVAISPNGKGAKLAGPPYHLCYELWQQNKLPSEGSESLQISFWRGLLLAAYDNGDQAAFTLATDKIRQRAKDAQGLRWVEQRIKDFKAKPPQ